jgi:hypothetical protein
VIIPKYNTQLIAEAMTSYHIKNVKKIEPREFLVKSFADRKHAPNLVITAEYFNQVISLSVPLFVYDLIDLVDGVGELLGRHVGVDSRHHLWNGSRRQIPHTIGV